jgi:hypothetical protein
LYACYALHPQPAYLDHPGLVGAVFRFVGDGVAPTPAATHRFTSVLATALPWFGVLCARGAGAAWGPALRVFFPLALVPEVSVGLFALTPDLPLAYLWIAALGLAGAALRSAPGGRTALACTLLCGFACGLAVDAKATGVLLFAAVAAAFAGTPARAHLKEPGPWLGLGVALVVMSPVWLWEQKLGFPMLAHRFVETQSRGGPSPRNVAALVGGQLVYVTPPFLVAAYRIFRGLVARTTDAVDRLLVLAAVVPAVPLVVLCIWSRVAEPHWLAPAYLSLALGASRVDSVGSRLARSSVALGLAVAVLTWVWVGTPLAPEKLGSVYNARYDLANDLYAWKGAIPIIEDELERANEEERSVAVVGPHWVICAQVHAAIGGVAIVGCESPIGDDFARWFPRKSWATASSILYVSDDRFAEDPSSALADRAIVGAHRYVVYRGGRVVRTVRITRLDRKGIALAQGESALAAPQPWPALFRAPRDAGAPSLRRDRGSAS